MRCRLSWFLWLFLALTSCSGQEFGFGNLPLLAGFDGSTPAILPTTNLIVLFEANSPQFFLPLNPPLTNGSQLNIWTNNVGPFGGGADRRDLLSAHPGTFDVYERYHTNGGGTNFAYPSVSGNIYYSGDGSGWASSLNPFPTNFPQPFTVICSAILSNDTHGGNFAKWNTMYDVGGPTDHGTLSWTNTGAFAINQKSGATVVGPAGIRKEQWYYTTTVFQSNSSYMRVNGQDYLAGNFETNWFAKLNGGTQTRISLQANNVVSGADLGSWPGAYQFFAVWNTRLSTNDILSAESYLRGTYGYGIGIGNGPASGTFITSASLVTLRNNFTGRVGCGFVSAGGTITSLGRWFPPGCTNNHVVGIYLTGNPAALASVTLNANSYPPNSYGYSGTSFTMTAGTTYFIESAEVAGQDPWYDCATTVSTDFIINAAAPQGGNGEAFNGGCVIGGSFGPINATYTVP